jgi:hypothetical protein
MRRSVLGRWLLLFIALSTVRGLLYSAVLLPWHAPDEPEHYEYVRLLYEKGRLVSWSDISPAVEQEVIASMDRFNFWETGRYQQQGSTFREIWGPGAHQLHQPPLGYLPYLVGLIIAPGNIALQVYLMRLIAVFLWVIIVAMSFWAAYELWGPESILSLAVPSFVVFLPTFTSLSGTINNDHLAELAISVAFVIWLVSFKRGLSFLRATILIAVSVIAPLAKRTGLLLLPVHLMAAILYLRLHHPRIFSRKKIVFALGVALLTVGLVIALATVGMTWLSEYAPDKAEYLAKIYLFLPSEQFPFSLAQSYFSTEAFGLYVHYARFLFTSFWGQFGLLNIHWPAPLFGIATIITVGALIGLVLLSLRLWKGSYRLRSWQSASLWLFAFSVAALIAMIYAYQIRGWDMTSMTWPQARYLFVVIIPIATLFVQGWSELVPQRHRTAWVIALLVLLVLLDTFSITCLIIPYFYG